MFTEVRVVLTVGSLMIFCKIFGLPIEFHVYDSLFLWLFGFQLHLLDEIHYDVFNFPVGEFVSVRLCVLVFWLILVYVMSFNGSLLWILNILLISLNVLFIAQEVLY